MVQRSATAHDAGRQDTERSVFQTASGKPSPSHRTSQPLATRVSVCQAVGTGGGEPGRSIATRTRLPLRAPISTHRCAQARRLTRVADVWCAARLREWVPLASLTSYGQRAALAVAPLVTTASDVIRKTCRDPQEIALTTVHSIFAGPRHLLTEKVLRQRGRAT